MPHHQADIVHMGGEAQGVPLAPQVSDDAALAGNGVRITQLIQDGAQELLDLLILAGGAVHRQEALEGIQTVFLVKRDHGMHSFANAG